jgi:hypothetical protein
LQSVHLTFQGGFVGTSVQLSATNAVTAPKKFLPLARWEPRDCNDPQRFEVPLVDTDGAESTAAAGAGAAPSGSVAGGPSRWVTNAKLTFPASTDFYGRITLYALDLQGYVMEGAPPAAAPLAAAT